MRACVIFPFVDRDDHRRGGERELVGGAVAQLQIERACCPARRRKRDVRDQVAGLEHRLALRRVAGQEVKVVDRNAARSPFVPWT